MVDGKLAFSAEEYKTVFLPRYRRDPARFAREICGVEPCEWQARLLDALVGGMGTPHGAHIALASGHETGKTYIACVAMFWGLNVIPDCHIYCTSATSDQLKTRLWSYMRRIVGDSLVSQWHEVDSEKVAFKHLPGNFIKAQSWSKDKPQSWAGEHCYSPWAVFDECSDIDTAIFEAWSGSSVKQNAVTVIMGQPRLRTGKLFDAFHKEKKEWVGMHLSCLESPFAKKEFIEKSRSAYGENSDYYRIRVLGQFPKADSAQLFPDAREKTLEAAEAAHEGGTPPVAGLDIAAGGADKTILVFREGERITALERFDTGDFPALAEAISSSLRRRRCGTIAADVIGYGYGLAQMLAQKKDITLVPVNGSQKAVNQRKYHNRRAEAYGRLSEKWDSLRFIGGSLSQNDLETLGRQLEAVRISYDKDMRISVLPKLEIKEEIGESPDLADALAYSFMASHEHGQTPEARQEKMKAIKWIQRNSNPYR